MHPAFSEYVNDMCMLTVPMTTHAAHEKVAQPMVHHVRTQYAIGTMTGDSNDTSTKSHSPPHRACTSAVLSRASSTHIKTNRATHKSTPQHAAHIASNTAVRAHSLTRPEIISASFDSMPRALWDIFTLNTQKTLHLYMRTGQPQHHLIISVPLPDIAEGDENEILMAHGVTTADIEPAVMALARRQGAEGLRRAARLAATNRALREHGFDQLLIAASPADISTQTTLASAMRLISEERRPICSDERAGIAAVGLTEAEYRAIKGVDGVIMGLHLDKRAYRRIKIICKHPENVIDQILRYARARLQQRRGPETKRKYVKKSF